MLKKMLITGIIVFSFFMITATSVNAADETRSFTDITGDVKDVDGTISYPEVTDIDMREITYTQDDEQVLIEIEFVGEIEDSIDISIIISLSTDKDSYEIGYLEMEPIGYNSNEEDVEVTFDGFGTDKLDIEFDLMDDDEDYDSLIIFIAKVDLVEGLWYSDMFPDFDELPDANIEAPKEGVVGESIQFYGSASGGTSPYEYSWDFDEDGDPDSEEKNPKYTFNEPGVYEVYLIITDDIGIPADNTTSITIKATIGSESDSDNNGSGTITFIILIAVVVIAGVAAVVYVIRR